jgi:hypothetical protein
MYNIPFLPSSDILCEPVCATTSAYPKGALSGNV